MLKKWVLFGTWVLIILISLFLLTGCGGVAPRQGEEHGELPPPADNVVRNGKEEASLGPDPEYEVTVHVVGDIMMHMPQIEAAHTGDGYDFLSFFAEVQPIFKEADLVMGNLETTFGGPERGYSGYPLFNAPDDLAVALKETGFDVITTANNHSLDTGADGLIRTLDILQEAGLKTTGTFRSAEEREEILLIEENHITLAILAYTYGTNGIPVPEGKEYLVNLIDEGQLQKDVKRAREKADFVAVSLHFGAEYQREPNKEQKQLVDKLFEWGVDLIFGSHPHVLQPYQSRQWEEGDELREGVVIYSLGNFISNQREEPRDIGGILSVTLSKRDKVKRIKEVEFIPTYVHRYQQDGRWAYQVLPMESLLTQQSAPSLNEADYQQLEQRYQETLQHVLP